MKAIITVGVSASGKSTWAEQFVLDNINEHWTILCRDNIRRNILQERHDRRLAPGEIWKMWKFKDEGEVNMEVARILAEVLARKGNVIIADTNLNKDRREALVKTLGDQGFAVEVKRFDVTFEEAMKRNQFRADSVGNDVLWHQYKQWFEQFGMFQKYKPDNKLPSCVMFDVDGTLAEMNGKRGPFEWDKVTLDDHRIEICEMARAFKAQGYKIVVMSGRDSAAREGTIQWLNDNDVPYDEIYMRAAGDMRKDWIVKGELFYAHVAPQYHAMMVVDDRPQVVRLWALLGIPCANVGEPMVEF